MDSFVSPDFEWRLTQAGRVIVSTALSAHAAHFLSSRDVSPGGAGQVDYAAVAAAFDVPDHHVVSVRQVHGCQVAIVRAGEVFGRDLTEADAIVSTDPARVISVRVADCVPILLADRGRRAVAAVHAGWRGTAAGVVGAAIDAFSREGIRASDVVAAIGPSIGVCCYEVDRVVRDAFERQREQGDAWFTDAGHGRFMLDLRRANRDQLIGKGVPADAIHGTTACTFDDVLDWHSHRRDGEGAGRMVAAIRLAGPAPL